MGQKQISPAAFFTGWDDIVAGLQRYCDFQRMARSYSLFLHNNGITTVRNGTAGHETYGLTGSYR